MAADVAGVEIEYVFVIARDDPTREFISNAQVQVPVHLVESGERLEADTRVWGPERYRQMVTLRNILLGAVNKLAPDYFLSLDSDVLLHEDALKNMLATAAEGFDAVGGKCWMTNYTDACSYIQLINSHGFIRPDVTDVIPVDVIMAIKLMNPKAYGVSYFWDGDGEDVGWSRRATAEGCKLAFDGRVCSRHVMARWDRAGRLWSDVVDVRCGY